VTLGKGGKTFICGRRKGSWVGKKSSISQRDNQEERDRGKCKKTGTEKTGGVFVGKDSQTHTTKKRRYERSREKQGKHWSEGPRGGGVLALGKKKTTPRDSIGNGLAAKDVT